MSSGSICFRSPATSSTPRRASAHSIFAAAFSNGHPVERLPNTLNVAFVGRPGADVIDDLEVVAASTGSACHADSIELSPVLTAMGVEPRVGMGAVRLSLGRMTTADEIDATLGRFAQLAAPG